MSAHSMPSSQPLAQLFLSHVHEDTSIAAKLATRLEQELGVSVFCTALSRDRIDLEDEGALWARLSGGIEGSTCYLQLISHQLLKRRYTWARRELQAALALQERMAAGHPFVLPVAVDGVTPQDAGLPENLQQIQWIDLEQDDALASIRDTVRRALILEGPAHPVESSDLTPGAALLVFIAFTVLAVTLLWRA